MKKNKSLDEFISEEPKDDIKANVVIETENNPVSLDQIAEVLDKVEEEKPKRRRSTGRGKGRKSKEQIDKEEKAEQSKQIMKLSFAYALRGLTATLAYFLKNPIWIIESDEESDYLALATIQYLDERFPEWGEVSPELNLVMAWSTYFAKRIFPSTESISKDKKKND